MSETIFSKIITREIPATIVYEDDLMIAFLDIAPISKGHTLLVTKEQHAWMDEAPDELIGKIFIQAKRIIQAMKQGIPCDYVQLGVVGVDVPHFHIHLIPQMFTDEIAPIFKRKEPYLNNVEKDLFANKIKDALLTN